jgi:GNAT superfamily N-acetyltransferase
MVGSALARRLERAGCRFMLGWMEAARAAPGNPLGLVRRPFGEAVAVARPSLAELDFMNTVYGLSAADAGCVEEIIAFYDGLGVRPSFELIPEPDFETLAERLHAAGAGQVGFHAVLAGVAERQPPAPLEVVELDGGARADEFARVLLEGHGVPAADIALEAAAVERWHGLDGLRSYVALDGGRTVAAGALLVADGIGYLANSATRPDARGRGAQTALVRRRIEDARAAGCELVSAQASFGGTSQRNLERAGMRVAFTKAMWRQHEPPTPG